MLVVAVCATVMLSACESKGSADATSAQYQKAVESYNKKHERFLKRAKEGNIDVLFVGDSLTEYWLNDGKTIWDAEFASWNPGNFGISGDTTYGVLARLGDELDGLKPKVVVLLIGTNDLSAGEKPETIASNIEKIVKLIKKKTADSKILILGLLPRGQSKDAVRKSLVEVNERISKYDNGSDIQYLDMSKKFIGDSDDLDIEIMPDLLHLSPKGYQIWADSVKDKITEMLGA